jgi:UDP-N-acetylmuramate: L-alanyl-gamma-D-glutamyl-meso-diaminopimelate ligase
MSEQRMHIHMLGICGTGMTALAQLFTEVGYLVTGSDQNVYPPMSTQLKKRGVKVNEGYKKENLKKRPDLVIVGNVITKSNPEAQEALKLGLPYRSMPQALSEFFLGERMPVVVAGTHGKSTLSTLTSWTLDVAGEDPGFFIGAVGRNFDAGARIGKGPFFIIEGDEYDSAFFDKGPKFLHYRPQVVILTSIEFDHADIYRDIDHLTDSFRQLVRLIPPDGMLIACAEYERVLQVAKEARCKVIYYGFKEDAYSPHDIKTQEDHTHFTLRSPQQETGFDVPLFGKHNLLNVVATLALMLESGIPSNKIQEGFDSFLGLARRQEILGQENDITIIDDFAHHPTAVRETINSVRARYPERRLWAIFEPRSNTSRRNVFQEKFIDAFTGADRVIIAGIHQPEKIPPAERLDAWKLADDLMQRGVDAHYIPDAEHILEFTLRGIDAGDVVLLMSNGDFEGIPYKLLKSIKGKRARARET